MSRLLVLLLVIALVTLAILLIRARMNRPVKPEPEDPREILKRRYAAGEIDEDEYFRRMSGLNQDW
ncbi:SHOCT domain-containing protein [Thermoactinospora rubra]|uniref:SHOCT domain-containing protein n=1 Tax=Thermoactinospora rubra TaxID=1088767 RepID=UPI000A102413|nr:SHOCT domain-containing protein [Thermoactinospora rubra]